MKSSNKKQQFLVFEKSCQISFNSLYAEMIQENETSFSNKNLLNSSLDLFFIAAAGKFMVFTAKFVWLFLLKITLPIRTSKPAFFLKISCYYPK